MIPIALLLAEYLILSFLVDLPIAGASGLVDALRLATPVALGALAAGWLLARSDAASGVEAAAGPPGRWRPIPALAAQLAVFAALAALTARLLHDGAPRPSTAELFALLAAGAVAIALALASAAPVRWLVRLLARRWRFPLIALAAGVLSWRAAALAEGLWGAVSGATLRATALLLAVDGSPVTLDPVHAIVGRGSFLVRVAPVCSGVDGIGLVVLFQSIWLSLARERLRFPRALALVPAGVAAALAANVLRIAALVHVGAAGNPQLAAGGLHSKLGWLLFIGIALGTIAAAERLRWFRRGPAPADRPGVPPEAAAYVAPLLAALATAVVTSAVRSGPVDRGYAFRIVAALAVLLVVRRSLPRAAPSFATAPILLGALVCAVWIAAAPAGALAGPPPLPAWERWAWIAARLAGSCLAIPVVEELAFRGFLLRWMVSPDFERVPPRAWTWTAVAVSSLAFGALHAQLLPGTLAGLAFAAARLWRGRLADAVLAHAVCNAGLAAAVLIGGRWDLWS